MKDNRVRHTAPHEHRVTLSMNRAMACCSMQGATGPGGQPGGAMGHLHAWVAAPADDPEALGAELEQLRASCWPTRTFKPRALDAAAGAARRRWRFTPRTICRKCAARCSSAAAPRREVLCRGARHARGAGVCARTQCGAMTPIATTPTSFTTDGGAAVQEPPAPARKLPSALPCGAVQIAPGTCRRRWSWRASVLPSNGTSR
jgi:hypothetical protein